MINLMKAKLPLYFEVITYDYVVEVKLSVLSVHALLKLLSFTKVKSGKIYQKKNKPKMNRPIGKSVGKNKPITTKLARLNVLGPRKLSSPNL